MDEAKGEEATDRNSILHILRLSTHAISSGGSGGVKPEAVPNPGLNRCIRSIVPSKSPSDCIPLGFVSDAAPLPRGTLVSVSIPSNHPFQ